MKIELSTVRLAVMALSKEVHVVVPDKNNITVKEKHNVHSDFLKCIVEYGAGTRFGVDIDGKKYQVGVIENKGFKKALYTRTDVLDILSDAVKAGVGDEISLDKFIEKKLK